MKKTVAAGIWNHWTMPGDGVLKRLTRNVLGTLNRLWKGMAGIDSTLSDGTPPTRPAVDLFMERLGYTLNADFAELTYGPSVGFAGTLATLATRVPMLKNRMILLNDGGDVATSVRVRASHSVGRHIGVRVFDRLEDFEKTPEHEVAAILNNGDNIQVKLDGLLPTFLSTDHAPVSLALEIVGKSDVFEQMEIHQGYIGPIINPVSQVLVEAALNATATAPVPMVHSEPVPSRAELETTFVDYFNSKTMSPTSQGSPMTEGCLVSGGCSGALYSILQSSSRSDVILAAPFFTPQKGIAEAANKEVQVVADRRQMPTILADTRDTDVLITFPNNPDGAIPTVAEMRDLIQVANRNGHRLIVDMTYFNQVSDPALENYHQVVNELKETASHFLIIASASKSLALTKYRVALVMGDPTSLAQVRADAPAIDSISALALAEGLIKANRAAVETSLSANVHENTRLITDILAETMPADELVYLNSGLQKLSQLIQVVGTGALCFSAGDGALYGTLSVAEGRESDVRSALDGLKLALTPGEIFFGKDDLDVKSVLETGQSSYRVSMMASPRVPVKATFDCHASEL